MRKHLLFLRKFFFILFLVCYSLATLCVMSIFSYDHHYHYLFYFGSLFLFLYFGTFLYDWKQGPFNDFPKKVKK